jgi:serine/threonine-protein kinase
MRTQKLDRSEHQTPRLLDDTLPSVDSTPKSDPSKGIAAGTVLGGKYQLTRLLGSGGMGEVYRGEHLTLGVPIAVKILRPQVAKNPESLRRFRREAHAVSLLHHPNVVRVLDFDEDEAGGVVFLVMELLEGSSLADLLDNLEILPLIARVDEIMRQIFSALEAAHALGIIHRDLKPENVYLARQSDGRELVKIVDFGLAHVDDVRDAGPTLTNTEIIAGTPQYMSPEQCKSLVVTPSSDLYAAGCVLTDLLQFRPPFGGKSPIEIISKQLFVPPPPLDRPEGAEPVPPLLERLRLDLLAKSPEQRPKSAREARLRLAEAMSPEATALRLPARKGDEPLGGRAERLPAWGEGPRSGAPQTGSIPKQVALLRLEEHDKGVSSLCVTGLAAQGISAADTTLDAPVEAPLLVLDAGANLSGAVAYLERTLAAPGAPRVVVCGAGVSAEQMNQLIAAGASDVVMYPVNADVLAKKIERTLKRKR